MAMRVNAGIESINGPPGMGCGGSRPKPPKAVAQRASLEAPRLMPDHEKPKRRLTDKTVAFSPPGAGRAVDLDVRAVQQGFRRRTAGTRKFHEHTFPDPAHCPPHEAVIHRLARSVFQWGIGPPTAGDDDLDDAADHPPVIHPPLAAHVDWQQWVDLLPLLVVQPEIPGDHVAPNRYEPDRSESATY